MFKFFYFDLRNLKKKFFFKRIYVRLYEGKNTFAQNIRKKKDEKIYLIGKKGKGMKKLIDEKEIGERRREKHQK